MYLGENRSNLPGERAACRAASLEWITGQDGSVDDSVPEMPGPIAILASKDNLRASPFLSSADRGESQLVLHLLPPVAVAGIVHASTTELRLSGAVVQVYSEEPNLFRLLQQVSVQDSGQWIANDVPDVARRAMMFKLLGPGIATDQLYYDHPNRGSGYFVEFDAKPEVLLLLRLEC